MKIKTIWQEGAKYPRFNVELYGSADEPFLTIKDCRLVDGSKGPFVSWPARKDDRGGQVKYFSYVFTSHAFGDAVVKEALKTAGPAEEPPPPRPPAPKPPARPSARPPAQASSPRDLSFGIPDDDDISF